MNQFRISLQTWALAIVSTLLLAETFFVLFPASDHDPRSPVTIKFSCAQGTGVMRLDLDRDADPALVQSINLRSDLTVWMHRGADVHYEPPDEYHGIPEPIAPRE